MAMTKVRVRVVYTGEDMPNTCLLDYPRLHRALSFMRSVARAVWLVLGK
jgi:hypothetical protein